MLNRRSLLKSLFGVGMLSAPKTVEAVLVQNHHEHYFLVYICCSQHEKPSELHKLPIKYVSARAYLTEGDMVKIACNYAKQHFCEGSGFVYSSGGVMVYPNKNTTPSRDWIEIREE